MGTSHLGRTCCSSCTEVRYMRYMRYMGLIKGPSLCRPEIGPGILHCWMLGSVPSRVLHWVHWDLSARVPQGSSGDQRVKVWIEGTGDKGDRRKGFGSDTGYIPYLGIVEGQGDLGGTRADPSTLKGPNYFYKWGNSFTWKPGTSLPPPSFAAAGGPSDEALSAACQGTFNLARSLGGFQEAGPDPDHIHSTHVITH